MNEFAPIAGCAFAALLAFCAASVAKADDFESQISAINASTMVKLTDASEASANRVIHEPAHRFATPTFVAEMTSTAFAGPGESRFEIDRSIEFASLSTPPQINTAVFIPNTQPVEYDRPSAAGMRLAFNP